MARDRLAVGHGSARLTVPPGSPFGGYADRTAGASGTLDPLEVHVLTFADGHRRFVWAVADLVCVNTDLADAVRAAVTRDMPGTRPATVWLSATHTHAAPETGCRPGGAATPEPWTGQVTAAVTAAARAAVRTEEPAELVLRRGELTGVGGQRSGPHPRLAVPYWVLEVNGAAARSLVVSLPVHPTVLGADNDRTSADLPGAVRRALDTDAWCVVATGAAGDVSTRPHRHAQTPEEVARLGDVVARQVRDLLAAPGIPVTGDGAVGRVAATADVPVPPRTDVAPDDAALAALQRQATDPAADPVQRRTAYTRWQGARLAHQATSVRDPHCAAAVLTVGDLRFAGIGAEPYLDLDTAWRSIAGPAGVLVGYTGGYLGYLPTAPAYDATEYEVMVSPCGPGAADAVLGACGRLLSSSDRQRM